MRICLIPLVTLCLLSCSQKQEPVSTGTWPEEKAKQWRASGVKDVENVAPMGVVPEWAKERMTSEEYDAWKVIATVFCVDYSFMKDGRYEDANKRAEIKESAQWSANDILANPEFYKTYRGALFIFGDDSSVSYAPHRKAPKVELRTDGSLRVQVYECKDFVCYADVVYEKQDDDYKVLSKKLSYSVNGVTDSGYLLDVIIEPDGDGVAIFGGFFHYKGETYNAQMINHFQMSEVEKK